MRSFQAPFLKIEKEVQPPPFLAERGGVALWIEILFEKSSFSKKFWLIYREVLSVSWPNFTVVKYKSKISNIYHQIKFRRSIMSRSSIKKLFLRSSQHSQENTCIGVSFSIKIRTFSPETLLKRSFNTGVPLWIL